MDPNGFAAGRENVDLHRDRKKSSGESCDGIEEMFTGIEDQESPSIPQVGNQTR
jgi:hypothetical protein